MKPEDFAVISFDLRMDADRFGSRGMRVSIELEVYDVSSFHGDIENITDLSCQALEKVRSIFFLKKKGGDEQ